MRRAGLAMLVLAVAGCSSASSIEPTATEDPAELSCRADVSHANLHVQDITALDFAIHDCRSLRMLKAAIAANPGYLDPSVSVREFAKNRCRDPAFLDVANARVCRQLQLP
jgi:hypothetical protein